MRSPKTPTMRWPSRQAMVVTGGVRFRKPEVNREGAAAGLDGSLGLTAGTDAPTIGGGLPQVLIVVQPVQARAQLLLPVPAQLFSRFERPVGYGHGNSC